MFNSYPSKICYFNLTHFLNTGKAVSLLYSIMLFIFSLIYIFMPYLLNANTHYTERNVGSLVNTHLLMLYSPSSGLLESPKEVCDGKSNSANGLDIRKLWIKGFFHN